MKKILIGLILFLLLSGCTENGTDKNANDKNILDKNQQTDLNQNTQDINFDIPPKKRMKEKLEENYYEVFGSDSEFPEKEFDFFECKGKNIFIGEGAINIVNWNGELIYFSFIECPEFNSIKELREKQLIEAKEKRTIETELFEGKEIRIENKEEDVETEGGKFYPGKYEYRYYNCEGIILEGIYLRYGTGDWDPKKYWFEKLFNDMISQCKT